MVDLGYGGGTRVTTTTERNRGVRPRIGIFGIGLAAYWPQFRA